MEGTCLCKAVAVKVNDDNLFGTQRRGHICHCKNCRKVAGGIFGTNLTIEEEKVDFPKGKDSIKRYDDPETLSGTPVQRYFCQNCGVPIMSITPLYKGKIILKLGLVGWVEYGGSSLINYSMRNYRHLNGRALLPRDRPGKFLSKIPCNSQPRVWVRDCPVFQKRRVLQEIELRWWFSDEAVDRSELCDLVGTSTLSIERAEAYPSTHPHRAPDWS